MLRPRLAWMLAALLCAGSPAAGGDDKPANERKFSGDHSDVLKGDGMVWIVEGRVRIPRGVDITVIKDTKLLGRGKGDAVIELEGSFSATGVAESRVLFENVTIEVQPRFQGLRLDMVDVDGGKGILSPPDKSVDGRVFVMNTKFLRGATVDLLMIGNEIDLQRCAFRAPVRVRAVDPAGMTGNSVKLNVLNCGPSAPRAVSGNLNGGLVVERVSDVTVRGNVLRGAEVRFTDCAAVTLDGNTVSAETLRFEQTVAGRFGKTQMQKCDVHGRSVVLVAPVAAGKPETMKCDKCWFKGETKEKAIREKVFKDADDDPKCGVTVDLTKVQESALRIASDDP